MPKRRPSRVEGQYTDLSTLFGRLASLLRRETGFSQEKAAQLLEMDRSLLARIESGRNTATLDALMILENFYIDHKVLAKHGDLMQLTSRAILEVQGRGVKIVYGKASDVEGVTLLDVLVLDRILGAVLDGWFAEA